GRQRFRRRRTELELSPIGIGAVGQDLLVALIELVIAVEILDRVIVITLGFVGHPTGGKRGSKDRTRTEFDGTVRIGDRKVQLTDSAVRLCAAGQDIEGIRVQCKDPIEILYRTRIIALVMVAEAPNRQGGGIVWISPNELIRIGNRA